MENKSENKNFLLANPSNKISNRNASRLLITCDFCATDIPCGVGDIPRCRPTEADLI